MRFFSLVLLHSRNYCRTVMRSWKRRFFFEAVVLLQLQILPMCSTGCCGPSPKPRDCRCQMLKEDDITCYSSKFNGYEPKAKTPQITAYPQGGTVVGGVEVALSCSVSYVSSPTCCPLTVIWEHNGTIVDSGLDHVFEKNVYNSTLTIPEFSASAQGEYVCRVGYKTDSGSIASPAAILQLPKFLGWIDKVYPPPPTDANSVTLIVQKGSSVILECSPNTTESLNRQTPQLDNKTAVHLLPSGNVLVPDVQEDVSISCVWPLHPPQTRNFHISISSDPPPEDLRLAVRPADTMVPAGSSLELYCIPQGPGPASITWYKDDVAVQQQSKGDGQVLVIRGTTASDGGTYTCSVSDGFLTVNASAAVTVVDPPGSVSLSMEGDTSGLNIDLQTRVVTVSPSLTGSSLRLSCQVDTSTSGLHYQWLHGGVVRDEGEGMESLDLDTSHLDTLTGSYQCIVANIAGRQLSQALWILIDGAKPHPPANVEVIKNTSPGVYFEYDIRWERPEEGFTVTNYTVETLSMSDGVAANYCSCIDYRSEVTNPMFAFWAGCFLDVTRDYTLFTRVAANTKDSQSDFVLPGESTTVSLDAPPNATNLIVEREPTRDKWDLSLSWKDTDILNYSPVCYTTDVELPCGTVENMVSSPVKASMKCCTQCEWSVINNNSVRRASTMSRNYSTPALKPSAPPQLISVERLGTNFSVLFQLPEESKSCMCGVEEYFQVKIRTNDTSITPVSTNVPLGDSSFKVNIPGVDCSAVYEISVAFYNSEGMSPYSDPATEGLPSGNNIPTFPSDQALQYKNASEREVRVSYQLEPGAGCLLAQGLFASNICYTRIQSSDTCSSSVLNTQEVVNCTNVGSEGGQLSLPRYHTFCVVATIWSKLLDMNTSTNLLIPANEGVPSQQPRSLTVSQAANDALNISWSAPPNESWHGIPYGYRLNISTAGGELVNSTLQPVWYTSLMYQNYNSSLTYNVTILACTRVGCGPLASSTVTPYDYKPATEHPSKGSDSWLLTVIVTSSTVFVLAIIALIIIPVSCTCYHRRRKKYARLRNESIPDIRTAELFEENESLVASRGPPTGAPARSEYTDFESLHSEDSRVGEWVRQTNSQKRDGYVRDADDELALILGEQDTTQPSNPPLAPPTEPPTETQSSNGYCSESGGSLQASVVARSSGSIGTTPLSSGYSTELHTTPMVGSFASQQSLNGRSQAAYTGIHNPVAQLQRTECTFTNHPNAKSSVFQATPKFMDPDDFISSLLCQVDFDPPNANPTPQPNELVLDSSSPYIGSDTLALSNPMTAGSSHPARSGDQEEETDSVFDTSMSPARHSANHAPPGRTRSSMTSGFLSLSDTSLDSSDNMEMTSIAPYPTPTPPPLNGGHKVTSWRPPSQQATPVIPSLLSSQVNTSSSLLQPPPPLCHMSPLTCYENIDTDPLVHEKFRFEL